MAQVITGTATAVSASTKVKIGVALGFTGAVFASLAAGIGAVPSVTTIKVLNDTKVYTGAIRPDSAVLLSRFNVESDAPVRLQSIDVRVDAKGISTTTIGEPYHLLFYSCGNGYGYGGYGYDVCTFHDVSTHLTVSQTDSRLITRFVFPTDFKILAGNRAWFDVVSAVGQPAVKGGTFSLRISSLNAVAVSGGTLGVQIASTITPTRPVLAPGDVIRSFELPALFYLGADLKRYPFPNRTTYDSWYRNQLNVIRVSQSQLTSYPIGPTVVIRPGTHLIKVTTDPKVYAVTPGGIIRWIQTEAVGAALYGQTWKSKVVDVPDVFFSDYQIGASLSSAATYPDGTIIRYYLGRNEYLISQGQKRLITPAGFRDNRLDAGFVVTGVDEKKYVFPDGPSVVGYEPGLSVPAGPLSGGNP